VRDHLDRILHDATFTAVALAIAAGWSLYQVALGIADIVEGLLTHYPSIEYAAVNGQALTWRIGQDHLLTIDQLMKGSVELCVVLLAAIFISTRAPARN